MPRKRQAGCTRIRKHSDYKKRIVSDPKNYLPRHSSMSELDNPKTLCIDLYSSVLVDVLLTS